MPLFFLATGVTLKMTDRRSLCNRAITLAIPYFVMSAIMVPVTHHFEPTIDLHQIFLGIIYGTGHTIDIVPLWFLTCTVSGLILLALLTSVFEFFGKDIANFRIITGALLIAIGQSITFLHPPAISFNYGWGSFQSSGLLWNMDLAPIAAGYMLIGSSLTNKLGHANNHSRSGLTLIAVGSWVLLFVLVFEFGAKLDLNYRRVDSSFLGVAASFLGIAGTLAFCMLIQRIGIVTTALSYVAQSGLVILWLHGGLQNKGFKIIFGGAWGEPNVFFWLLAFLFATTTPIIIDRFLIRKSPLKSAFYPRAQFF